MPDATSLSRATSFSVTNVSQFFECFETVICRHAYELRQIWNLDETDLITVQKWREKRGCLPSLNARRCRSIWAL